MKNKKHTTNGSGQASQTIRIEFNHPTASAVGIAGTFNEWHAESAPMVAVGGGRWLKDLALAPGVYEYRLVVDGRWMADPQASETTPNPFGEVNSVLKVNGGAG
jgi:1,4-alpha-glucan branching enzyme